MNTRERKMTLEDLSIRKRELRKRVDDQRGKIIKTYNTLIEPFTFNAVNTSLIKKITTGFAIFDGFMIGLKIIRKIKTLFR